MRKIIVRGSSRCLFPVLLVIPVLLISSFAFAASYRTVLQQDSLTKIVLKNGLTVVLSENHAAPVVAFQMWVNVGSRNESDAQAGISHVFEHMLFKGTAKRGVGEIAREVEAAGGNINAYTSNDHTVYHLALASRYFDVGLDVLSDAVQHSAFDPKELAKEEEVILEEFKRSEDMPSRVLSTKLFETAYRVHPYRRPVIGYVKTFKKLTRKNILDYFHEWYVPNNMTLVVVGDFSTPKVLPSIVRSFQGFVPRKNLFLSVPREPAQSRTRAVVIRKESKQVLFNFGYHIPGLHDPKNPAYDLLAAILGQGKTSRLYQEVKRKRELVHAVSAYAYTPNDPGLFVVEARLDGKYLKKTLGAVLDQIERIKHEPVSAEELYRARVGIESDFIYKKETMEGQAGKFGAFESDFGDPLHEKVYLSELASVTPADLTAIARKIFRPENLTVSILIDPKEQPGLDAGKIRKIVQKLNREAAREYAKHKETKRGEPEKIVLSNGIRLIVKENHAVPTVAVKIAFPGGERYETEPTSGLYHFMAAMLDRGTKKRSADEIATEIEEMAGSVSGFSGRNSIGAQLSVLSRHFGQGMNLLADLVRHPAFAPDEVEKTRKDILAAIVHEDDQLSRRVGNLFRKTLYKTHPYRMRLIGKMATVSRFTPAELRETYRHVLNPAQMVIAVVGDVSREEAEAKVRELFGTMKKIAPVQPHILQEVPQEKIRESVERVNRQQAHMILGFLGTTVTSGDRYPLMILSNVLAGQGGRLFRDLRDKESLAYVVTAFSQEGVDPGFFAAYIACSPEKLDAARAGILKELARVRDQRIPENEMKRARENLIGSFEIGLQTNESIASTMVFDELYGNGFDAYKEFARKIEKVTAKDVQKVAERYLDLTRYSVALVKPGEE
ncbi:MAG: insulinase family protein [Deltaproteobacteria bacterium]|nr:insulinase family protein [Deltaproteobacteria bacterium]